MQNDGYRLKHGRGMDVNRDLYTDDDIAGQKAYKAAGVAVVQNYRTEVVPSLTKAQAKAQAKKMAMYSSVGAEERQRQNEIQEERNNLEYQKFNNNDVTAENGADTLGMTQPNLHSLDDGMAEMTPRKIVPAQGKLLKGKGKYDAVG